MLFYCFLNRTNRDYFTSEKYCVETLRLWDKHQSTGSATRTPDPTHNLLPTLSSIHCTCADVKAACDDVTIPKIQWLWTKIYSQIYLHTNLSKYCPVLTTTSTRPTFFIYIKHIFPCTLIQLQINRRKNKFHLKLQKIYA